MALGRPQRAAAVSARAALAELDYNLPVPKRAAKSADEPAAKRRRVKSDLPFDETPAAVLNDEEVDEEVNDAVDDDGDGLPEIGEEGDWVDVDDDDDDNDDDDNEDDDSEVFPVPSKPAKAVKPKAKKFQPEIDWTKLHKEYMKKWTVANRKLKYSEKQIEENCKRFRERLRHVLQTHVDAGTKYTDKQFRALGPEDRPMSFAWWAWCGRLDIDAVLDFWNDHTPEVVQVVLGRPGRLRPEIIDELPDDWKDTMLQGGYCDFVTFDDQDGYEPYVGSATGKKGLKKRISEYDRISRTGAVAQNASRHEKLIAESHTHPNPRIFFVLDRTSGHSAYGSMGEQLFAAYMGVHKGAKKSRFFTDAAKKVCEDALPVDFRPLPYKGLNDAAQMLQAITWRRQDRRCANKPCPVEKSSSWALVDPRIQYGPRLCGSCTSYRYRYNKMRPAKLILSAERRRKERQAGNAKQADGICANPNCPAKLLQFNQLTGGNWLCSACHCYANNNGGQWRPASLIQLAAARDARPKPADKICEWPGCDREVVKGAKWQFNPASSLWVCRPCYEYARRHGLL